MNNYCITLLCLIAAVFGQFSCAPLTTAGGSSSTDNGKILGRINLENGQPASRVQVTLLPAYNNPFRDNAAHLMDTTDTAGGYAFGNLAAGNYTVEAVSIDDRTRALLYGISVDSTVTYAPIASVAQPGALRITVSIDTTAAVRYVYLPGTSRFGIVQNGSGFIDSVAPGIIPSVYYVTMASPAESRVITTNVQLASGATKVVADYSSWNYSKRLLLNTTAAGANVPADVFNFPVLVRLSGANFNFGQAQPDGSDLRFKKLDDSPLPYEIERWDPAAGQAEVWVKVDTIRGSDSTQSIVMYWGNPNAADSSSGSAVFDTAAAFQGVWHFSEAGNAVAFDATANHYDGTTYGMSDASSMSGAIGKARAFDGSSSYITMPNTATGKLDFPQGSYYTVSAWVLVDTIDNASHLIVSKGYEQYYLRITSLRSNSPLWEFVEFNETAKWQTSTFPATGGQWTLLTGVRQGSRQFLYSNGVLVDSSMEMWQNAVSRNTSNDLSIGKFLHEVTVPINDGYCFFKGSIDEVRICNVSRSVDWIKLCYMNQRMDDQLVIYGK